MWTKQEKELVLSGLKSKAKYMVGEPVHWRGTTYRITGRYYRRSLGKILYDMKEERQDGKYPRYQSKRDEQEIEPFKRP